jgi:hypothetical protein
MASPGALPNGQQGIQIIDGVTITVDKWAATQCNPAPAPLVTPDAGLGLAPVNDSNVENSSVTPQIEASGTYEQPNTSAPPANPAITISGAAPPNQIEVVEGENVRQPNTANPVSNPEVTVGGAVNGNPMNL